MQDLIEQWGPVAALVALAYLTRNMWLPLINGSSSKKAKPAKPSKPQKAPKQEALSVEDALAARVKYLEGLIPKEYAAKERAIVVTSEAKNPVSESIGETNLNSIDDILEVESAQFTGEEYRHFRDWLALNHRDDPHWDELLNLTETLVQPHFEESQSDSA